MNCGVLNYLFKIVYIVYIVIDVEYYCIFKSFKLNDDIVQLIMFTLLTFNMVTSFQ